MNSFDHSSDINQEEKNEQGSLSTTDMHAMSLDVYHNFIGDSDIRDQYNNIRDQYNNINKHNTEEYNQLDKNLLIYREMMCLNFRGRSAMGNNIADGLSGFFI